MSQLMSTLNEADDLNKDDSFPEYSPYIGDIYIFHLL